MNRPEPDDDLSRLRVPPHSVEAEQSVLGALLLDSACFDRVGDLVAEGDFYRHEHRLIFEAVRALSVASKTADVITVYERLKAAGKADAVGGLQHLNALAASVPGTSGARRWAELIREKALLRAVIALSDNAATAAFNPQGRSAADVVGDLAAKVGELERQRVTGAPKPLSALVAGRLDRVSRLASGEEKGGLSTSIDRLDRVLNGGFRPGAVYILAARPSVGKSSLAMEMGLHVARFVGPVLMLSQEMPDGEVADRALSNLGAVDYEGIQTGKLSDDGWSRLSGAVETAAAVPFYVDDQPGLRLRDIRAKARQVKGLKLLVLDYLQLSVGDGENRSQEVGSISRGLKALAKQMGIPVLVLSQLNRKVEERPGKEPEMGDLRDSGEIEQDADVVMFLWPARDFIDGVRLVGLKVGKNRQGRPGARFALDFAGAWQRWSESEEKLPKVGGGFSNDKGFE